MIGLRDRINFAVAITFPLEYPKLIQVPEATVTACEMYPRLLNAMSISVALDSVIKPSEARRLRRVYAIKRVEAFDLSYELYESLEAFEQWNTLCENLEKR